MYGDYEAQRHWMELTTNLPVSQWYFHDLSWWGLDYPPLTAYHSWVLGKIGGLLNPKWFALYTSRGIDDAGLKVFMRATVIVSEYLVYVPAAVIFVRRFSKLSRVPSWNASVALVAILMQPALILVDHVHFQYNSVMLGLVVATMSSVLAGRLLWSCVFFVLALGFKQMALYYAPAIFAYLLGVCILPKINATRLFGIATVTAATFGALLLPLYLGALYDSHRGIDAQPELVGKTNLLPIFTELGLRLDTDAWYYPIVQQTAQLLHRVFPFARGLFEDKVANFWCAANIIHKLGRYPQDVLQKASLLLTLAGISIPCLTLFLKPKKELLPIALASTSWAFFLFSFQVHEKSVLLPLMPMTMLLAGHDGFNAWTKSWIMFANILGTWTLFPLLKRVGLQIPYFVFLGLWCYGMYMVPATPSTTPLPEQDFSKQYFPPGTSEAEKARQIAMLKEQANDIYDIGSYSYSQILTIIIQAFFYQIMAAWHIVEAFAEPPEELPDLFVVGNVGIGAAGFAIIWVWCMLRLVSESGIFQESTTRLVLQEKKKQ